MLSYTSSGLGGTVRAEIKALAPEGWRITVKRTHYGDGDDSRPWYSEQMALVVGEVGFARQCLLDMVPEAPEIGQLSSADLVSEMALQGYTLAEYGGSDDD